MRQQARRSFCSRRIADAEVGKAGFRFRWGLAFARGARQTGDAMDDPINARLHKLCERFGKANLARACSIPASSLSRYLGGARIPGQVLSDLAARMEVNPQWLLEGEGPMMKFEVARPAHSMAEQLMSLVESMRHVTRLKLGAVMSDNKLKAVFDLRQSIHQYHEQLKLADAAVTPALREMLDRIETLALRDGDWDQAEMMAAGVEMLAEFCTDPRVRLRIDSMNALRFALHNELAKALTAHEAGLSRVLALRDWDESSLKFLHDHLRLLLLLDRGPDALRLCEAALALVKDNAVARSLLWALKGAVYLEVGDAGKGLSLLQEHFERVPAGTMKDSLAFDLARGRFFCGATLHELPPESEGSNALVGALVFGIVAEDADLLERALERPVTMKPQRASMVRGAPFVIAYARALHAALRDDPKPMQDFIARHLPATDVLSHGQVWMAATRVQALRLTGKLKDASALALRLDEVLQSPPTQELPSVRTRALHGSNVIKLFKGSKARPQQASLARGTAILKDLFERGYWGLKRLVP